MDRQFLFRDQKFQRGVDADIRSADTDTDQAIGIFPDLFAELNKFVQKTVFHPRRKVEPAGEGTALACLVLQIIMGLLDGRQQSLCNLFSLTKPLRLARSNLMSIVYNRIRLTGNPCEAGDRIPGSPDSRNAGNSKVIGSSITAPPKTTSPL